MRFHLPADGVDRGVPVDRAQDRGRPPEADEARGRPLEPRKIALRTASTRSGCCFPPDRIYSSLATSRPSGELGGALVGFCAQPVGDVLVLFCGLPPTATPGRLREQVSGHVSAYARFRVRCSTRTRSSFQSDRRAASRAPCATCSRKLRASGKGDQVDCTLCVQVCPTGIDIRDGLQVGCTACEACVDVCNSVMDKVNYPGAASSVTPW